MTADCFISGYTSGAGYRRGATVRLPHYAMAVLHALRFSDGRGDLLTSLNGGEWKKLLAFCDTQQLTLTLGHVCGSYLPSEVRNRIDGNYRSNALRFARLDATVGEICDLFAERKIEFVLLKGSAHWTDYVPDPLLRATGDIDIWCRPESVMKAYEALTRIGYRPIIQSKGRHLAPLVREAGWQWTGDYYAADLPIPIDLHYKIWDQQLEHIPGPPEHEFWDRRCSSLVHGRVLAVLSASDALAFAALHLLMHMLHGDLRLQRAWEIGYFLSNRALDEHFWMEWSRTQNVELRKLQVIVLILVRKWFGCRLPSIVQDLAEELPQTIKRWVSEHALSPVAALFGPNKDVLWLNLCLVDSFKDKAIVFLRRILPITASAGSGHNPKFLASRAAYHLWTLAPTLTDGLRWWWRNRDMHARCSASDDLTNR